MRATANSDATVPLEPLGSLETSRPFLHRVVQGSDDALAAAEAQLVSGVTGSRGPVLKKRSLRRVMRWVAAAGLHVFSAVPAMQAFCDALAARATVDNDAAAQPVVPAETLSVVYRTAVAVALQLRTRLFSARHQDGGAARASSKELLTPVVHRAKLLLRMQAVASGGAGAASVTDDPVSPAQPRLVDLRRLASSPKHGAAAGSATGTSDKPAAGVPAPEALAVFIDFLVAGPPAAQLASGIALRHIRVTACTHALAVAADALRAVCDSPAAVAGASARSLLWCTTKALGGLVCSAGDANGPAVDAVPVLARAYTSAADGVDARLVKSLRAAWRACAQQAMALLVTAATVAHASTATKLLWHVLPLFGTRLAHDDHVFLAHSELLTAAYTAACGAASNIGKATSAADATPMVAPPRGLLVCFCRCLALQLTDQHTLQPHSTLRQHAAAFFTRVVSQLDDVASVVAGRPHETAGQRAAYVCAVGHGRCKERGGV